MSGAYTGFVSTFNLRTARLRPGEAWRGEVAIALEPLELGGQRYVPVPAEPVGALAITRLTSGLLFELAFDVVGGEKTSPRSHPLRLPRNVAGGQGSEARRSGAQTSLAGRQPLGGQAGHRAVDGAGGACRRPV